MTLYRFPSQLTPLFTGKSKDHLYFLIQEELRFSGLHHDFRHIQTITEKSGQLKFKCQVPLCNWKLIYKQEQGVQTYTLVRSFTFHFHQNMPILRDPGSFGQKGQIAIENIIYEGDICKFLQIKYNMSTKEFVRYSEFKDSRTYGNYGVLLVSNENRKRRNQPTIEALKNLYYNLSHSILFLSRPELQSITSVPDFVFLATKNSLKIYKAKGQIVCMTVLKDKIIETNEDGKRMVCVLFYTLLANYQCILFAVAIFPENYMVTKKGNMICGLYQAITIFFTKLPCCETFITESDSEIVKTTKYTLESKFPSIFHLVDPYDYVYKKFPEHLVVEALKIILSETEGKYAQNLRNLYRNINYSEQDKKFLSECLKVYGEKSLYANGNTFFIAGLLLEDANYTISQMLKYKIRKQSLGKLLEQFLKMTLKIDKLYEKKELSIICYLRASKPSILALAYPFKLEDRINQDPQFIQKTQYYRLNFYKEGFSFLLGQLSRTGETDIREKNQSLEEVEFRDSDNSRIICQFNRETGKYICSCNYTKNIGIPCKHLCKLCLILNMNIEDYIEKYWKLEQSYTQMRAEFWLSKGLQPPKQGPPRKANRNTVK